MSHAASQDKYAKREKKLERIILKVILVFVNSIRFTLRRSVDICAKYIECFVRTDICYLETHIGIILTEIDKEQIGKDKM